MFNRHKLRSRQQHILITLLLSMLALAGNYFSLPLFFGVDFIFGSIAVMLSVALSGLPYALFVALAGGIYTLVLWGHPYAMIIFAIEAVFVSWLYARKSQNLVILDLFFWVCIGVPMVLVFYRGFIGMGWEPATLIALKQPLNGLMNTVIASVSLLLLSTKRKQVEHSPSSKPKLEEVLFYGFLSLTLLASFISITYHSHSQKSIQETFMFERLSFRATELLDNLQKAYSDKGLQYGFNLDSIYIYDDAGVAFIAPDGRVAAAKGNIKSLNKPFVGENIYLSDNYYIWLPEGDLPLMQRWKQGRYVYHIKLGAVPSVESLVVELPALPLVQKLNKDRISLFVLLAFLFCLAIVTSYLLSRWISSPLIALDRSTKEIASQIASGHKPLIPVSRFHEYQSLGNTIQLMSDTLVINFDELNQNQQKLTRKVEQRTQDYSDQVSRTQAILDNILDGIITIDEQGIIQSVNPAVRRCFQLHDDQLLGKNIGVLLPEDRPYNYQEMLDNFLTSRQQSGIGIGKEATGKRADGSTFPMDLAISELHLNDKTLYIAMVRDISERKRIERMKNEFISTVSHELRTPLTAISGALGLINGGAAGEVPEPLANMLELALNNSQRLNLLINDLLDMEKLLAGKMRLDIKALPVKGMLETALANNQAYARQFDVRLVLGDIPEGLQVMADEARFAQIMANLLSNAAKFSPAGADVLVKLEEQDEQVRIAVIDSGPGIPEEFHGRIFQKFSQADGSDTRQKGGTGLGLAISRELVEHMQGSIDFISSDSGCEFYFYLPRAQN